MTADPQAIAAALGGEVSGGASAGTGARSFRGR
jgi:hypothetical protein